MYKIIFTASDFFGQRIDQLKIDGFEFIKQSGNLTENELVKVLQGAHGYILGGDEVASRKVIESAKDLKVIAFVGAGYENYVDVKVATEQGITVTNTPGANAQTVAELTAGLILTAIKQIIPMNENAKKGIWEKRQVADLKGKTLGIVGAGNIGSKVAAIMKQGFGMNILYHSKSIKSELEKKLDARKTQLEDLLTQSDVVSLHVPLTDKTEGMLSTKELSLMKSTAILINAARAKLVDGNALYAALKNDRLGAAAFDVYYEEPAPKPTDDEYKLLTLTNDKFILTPHNGSNSEEAYDNMTSMAVEGVLDVILGKKPKHQVN